MWGAWPFRAKVLLAIGLFIRYVAPVLVGAGVLTVGAYYFFRALFGGLHP
jgi:hypothetical protein